MPDAGDRARARRIIDRVRSYGVEVREMPGHENRGGTFVVVPVKVFDHHDASSRKSGEWGSLGLILDGTPRGIPGPLSNAQVARCLDGAPRIAWVADGTCSHGGQGSGLGLPTNAANPRTYGVEKANDGIGEPYTAAANYATNALFHAMAVECDADPATYVWGHKEWTPRKVDPLYSMPDRRRQVGAFTPRSMEDDMLTAKEVVDALFDHDLHFRIPDEKDPRGYTETHEKVGTVLTDLYTQTFWGHWSGAWGPGVARQLQALLAMVPMAAAPGGDIDVDALLARIDERVKANVQAGLAEGVDVRVTVGDSPA